MAEFDAPPGPVRDAIVEMQDARIGAGSGRLVSPANRQITVRPPLHLLRRSPSTFVGRWTAIVAAAVTAGAVMWATTAALAPGTAPARVLDMLAVGAVVRLANRRLALIVSAALAPGILANVAWLVWLQLVPWSLQAIGTAIVLVMYVVWLLSPYTVLWGVVLLVSASMRGLALRMASLVMLVAAALLLDGSTASLAWASTRVGGKALVYTFMATPLLQLLGLVAWALLWGLALAVTALTARAGRATGMHAASAR